MNSDIGELDSLYVCAIVTMVGNFLETARAQLQSIFISEGLYCTHYCAKKTRKLIFVGESFIILITDMMNKTLDE